MITMVLGGLWHGAAWNFVFWGFLHGIGLAGTYLYWTWLESRGIKRRRKKKKGPIVWQVIGVFLTFHYVCLGWVFFRADSFAKAWAVLGRLTTFTTYHPNLHRGILLALFGGLIAHYTPDKLFGSIKDRFVGMPFWAQGAAIFVLAVILHEVASAQSVPFVYFQF
jgi:hypothetical protein